VQYIEVVNDFCLVYLFETMFLLIDNALYQHGHTVDPGDGQAQRHHMLYHEDKPARKTNKQILFSLLQSHLSEAITQGIKK
jgi:hypothetical protein